MKLENIFKQIEGNFNKEIIDSIVNSDNIRIERIVSKGHISPEGFWYDQEENEFVLLLQGKAALEFDNKNIVHLKRGDYLIIEKHEKHRVIYTAKNTLTVWLAVFYQ